jgi:hypothetical protein
VLVMAGRDDDRRYRALRRLPPGAEEALGTGLSASDLRTVLLGVARTRAADVTPAEVARRWSQDQLVRPNAADPRRVSAVEADLWRYLPAEVQGVGLSPVTPLGTCTVVASGSQDRIVSTMRSSEVMSDLTNTLAIEAAARRRAQAPDQEVHLAACTTVLRAQPFGAGWSQHFRLFGLVSSARDTGYGRTQARLLLRHVTIWQRALAEVAPGLSPRVDLTPFEGDVVAERLPDVVSSAAGTDVPVGLRADRLRGRGYYVGAALRLSLGGDTEVGDGGLTSWTAQLTGDAKERCMVSCLATERLASLLP